MFSVLVLTPSIDYEGCDWSLAFFASTNDPDRMAWPRIYRPAFFIAVTYVTPIYGFNPDA